MKNCKESDLKKCKDAISEWRLIEYLHMLKNMQEMDCKKRKKYFISKLRRVYLSYQIKFEEVKVQLGNVIK